MSSKKVNWFELRYIVHHDVGVDEPQVVLEAVSKWFGRNADSLEGRIRIAHSLVQSYREMAISDRSHNSRRRLSQGLLLAEELLRCILGDSWKDFRSLDALRDVSDDGRLFRNPSSRTV